MTSLSIAKTSTLAGALLCAASAQAGQQEGVRCEPIQTAIVSNGNKNLVCRSSGLSHQKSICSPLAFSAKGITVAAVTLDPVGRDGGIDQCVAPGGQRVDSMMEPMPVYASAPSRVTRKVSATGPDTFDAEYEQFHYPVISPGIKLPVAGGNPALGVTCPSGYDGDLKRDNDGDPKGIRCDKYDGSPKTADCDIGWTVLRDNKGEEDRCLGPMGLSEGPTKPTGMTKIQFDAERALPTVGWVLNKKSGADTWQRKVYAYPIAR